MNSLTIAYYTMLRNIRDVKTVFALILLPLVLVLLVGSALDTMYTPQNVKKIGVGYLSDNPGPLSGQFEPFIRSDRTKELLDIEEMPTLEEGLSRVKSGKLEAFIYIPTAGPSTDSTEAKQLIQVYGSKRLSAVQPLVDGFVQTVNAKEAVARLETSYKPAETTGSVEDVPIETKGRIPRGIDYYAVTMILQCLLLCGAVIGTLSVTRDTANHTDFRVRSAPVKRQEILFGRIAGGSVTLFASSVIAYTVTRFVYQANWNGSLFAILLVLLLFSIICICLGILAVHLAKSTVLAVLITACLTLIFTLASGGFSQWILNPTLEAIGRFTPNLYAQQAIFKSIYGGTASQVQSSVLVLACAAGVLVLLTWLSDRRKAR